MMIKGFLSVLVLMMIAAHPARAIEWHEGGTLQKATVAEWQQATPDNQYATAVDFIAALSGISDLKDLKNPEKIADLKKRAADLQVCVNQMITEDMDVHEKKVAELIVFCTIMKKSE